MAKRQHTTADTRPVADRSVTFKALDLIDTALSDLAHTAEVLDGIDPASDRAFGLTIHMHRHLLADLAKLQEANKAARAAILNPAKVGKGGAA